MAFFTNLIKNSIHDDQLSYCALKQMHIVHEFAPICSSCGQQTHFERGKIRNGINGSFRCSKRDCQRWHSIFSARNF